jgi:hypothetical protein
MYKYDLLDNGTVVRTDEEGKVWFIPADPANADYQTYLNKDTLPSELVDPAPADKPKK